jgi:hypothetical protein
VQFIVVAEQGIEMANGGRRSTSIFTLSQRTASYEPNPAKPSVVRVEIDRDVAQAADDGERQHRKQKVED